MTASQDRHDRMVARLKAYAAARDDGDTPREAVASLGLAESAHMRYERWYRVAYQGQQVRTKGDGLRSFGRQAGRVGDIGGWK